ncbi:MAG: hypothetical protein AB7H93_16720 [Vicinamibacterales bacterium]
MFLREGKRQYCSETCQARMNQAKGAPVSAKIGRLRVEERPAT